jgi:hypothetical protein
MGTGRPHAASAFVRVAPPAALVLLLVVLWRGSAQPAANTPPGLVVLLAAHDPGSRNHVEPLVAKAREEGALTTWRDLREGTDVPGWALQLVDDAEAGAPREVPRVLVLGSSAPEKGQPLEQQLLKVARARGFRVVQEVENGLGQRLKGVRAEDQADRYMITTPHAEAQLRGRPGLKAARMALVGSSLYERLQDSMAAPAAMLPAQVRAAYAAQGLGAGGPLVVYFAPVRALEPDPSATRSNPG